MSVILHEELFCSIMILHLVGLSHNLLCLWSLCPGEQTAFCISSPQMFYISSESEQVFKIPSLFTCWLYLWLYLNVYLNMWRTAWIGSWPVHNFYHCLNDSHELHYKFLPWSPWKPTRIWMVGFADCAEEREPQCGVSSPGISRVCLLQQT